MTKMVEIKMSTVMAVSVILQSTDIKKIEAALRDLTGGADDFFDSEFSVIDIGKLPAAAFPDWAGIVEIMRKFHLNAVAVRHAPPSMVASILACGLCIDNAQNALSTVILNEPALHVSQDASLVALRQEHAAQTQPFTYLDFAPMVIDMPVRAGQRIYAKGRDLIVTAVVNNGAEIIADGNIHVYAPLRGRALAGAQGNTKACIYASVMEAELISIAGIYRTFENGFPGNLKNQGCKVRLDGEKIDLLPLTSFAKA